MDDDRKDKPRGRGPAKGGPRKDGPRKDGPRKDGPRREGAGGKPAGERKFSRPLRAEGGSASGERKPYQGKPRAAGDRFEDRPRRPRPVDEAGGERKFSRPPRRESDAPEGERKPYRGKPRDGEGASGGFREKRSFGDRKPFGEGRPPRKPFAGAASGEGQGWKRPEGDRSFGEKKPFRERKSFDGKPPRDGDRPRERSEGRFGDRSAGARPPRSSDRPVRDEAAPEEGERIAKRLARAGISSRRDAEEMIAAGRVKVNGKVLASPAVNVGPDDMIQVDNETIPAIERTRVFLFHKPGGVVTTNRDPEGRKTVFDVLPQGLPRLLTVGRLDINTEGLMLLTNDGGLARVLELPATGWLRRYRARVHGRVDENRLRELKDGIAVDGVFYGAIEATLDREQGSNAWLTIGLREGKNREVKNVLGALGLDVSRLIRVSFGPFQLGELGEGEVQELRGRLLRDQLGERLIEEAGANFEAPVLTEFSNEPVARPRGERGDRSERGDRDDAPPRRERKLEVGEGGLIKNRKRMRDDRRDDALGRLQTSRPPMRGKGGPGRKKEEKPFEPPRQRTANVWMAPGARPQTNKPERSEGDEPRRERPNRDRPSGDRPRAERPNRDRPSGDRPNRDRPSGDRPRGDGAPKPYSPRPPRGPKR
ncbi:MAG: pseudouridine synthase [Mesorhizobium sp.]